MNKHHPAPAAVQNKDRTTGTVKWFNAPKGYGFLAPDGGGEDVFVHISAVEKAGLRAGDMEDNTPIAFDLEDGRDGRLQAGNIRLLPRGEARPQHRRKGTVKWFNTAKGFGFIAPEGGGRDVFVHISAVERSGLTGLPDDRVITFDLEDGRDGRLQACNIKLV